MTEIESENLNLSEIDQSGQCFRWKKTGGGYMIPAFGKVLHARQMPGCSGIIADCTEEEVDQYWRRYFDLDTDYSAIIRSIPEKDSYLREAARFGSGIRILRQDPWETLITFLLSQRKNISAIRKSVERLCFAAGSRIGKEGDTDIFSFPSPEQLAAMRGEDLVACGLGYRARYVEQAAHAFCEGSVSIERMEALADGELLETLCGICGVGKKIALCTMLFGFHRTDSFPVDVWMNKVAERHYSGVIPIERYSPWAGIMQQYMFYYERYLSGKLA